MRKQIIILAALCISTPATASLAATARGRSNRYSQTQERLPSFVLKGDSDIWQTEPGVVPGMREPHTLLDVHYDGDRCAIRALPWGKLHDQWTTTRDRPGYASRPWGGSKSCHDGRDNATLKYDTVVIGKIASQQAGMICTIHNRIQG